MSFPRYPEYKDSGVEWLGEVPAHWKVMRLKQVVDELRPITYGIVQAGENVPNGVPYIRPVDMSDEAGISDESTLLRTANDIARAYQRSEVREGDLVCSIGPSFGKAMVVPASLRGANLTQGTARIAIRHDYSARFFFWVLRAPSSNHQWESSVGGATFRALNLGPLSETAVPVPPQTEQASIAAFLDHETAKIDALVDEQKRLIELLKEKRQAVISHAVTKGLDPNVPMKDSGVEWLGEVPAHWEVLALKRVLSWIEQGWSPECDNVPADLGEWGVLKAGAVNNGVYREEENKTLPAEREPRQHLEVMSGDLLMSRASGSPELIGSVAYVRATRPRLMLSDKLFRLVVTNRVMPQFVALMLGSVPLRRQIEQSINGAEGLANNLSQSSIKDLRITLPPLERQADIVLYAEAMSRKLTDMIEAGEDAVRLLLERRSALISAAVTGKIDVRDWKPASSEATADTAAQVTA